MNYVQCINVTHASEREEKFYDLQLNIKDSNNIYESLEKYTEVETLEGDNKYDAEKYGKQEARKGTKFMVILKKKIFNYYFVKNNSLYHQYFSFS